MKEFLYFSLLISLVINISCLGSRKQTKLQNDIDISSQSQQNDTFKFNECKFDKDCVAMFDCHHNYFLSKQLFDYETIISSRRYFNFDSLLDCTISLFNMDIERSVLADKCLYEFHYKAYLKSVSENRSPIPTGDLSKSTFHKWNSIKSFEICLLYMSKNGHDSMGHGDCKNLGIEFFHFVVVPKILSIDGMQPYDYLYKNLKGVYDTNEDCQDSYYNAIYPLIKKAWEDGKIVLKTD